MQYLPFCIGLPPTQFENFHSTFGQTTFLFAHQKRTRFYKFISLATKKLWQQYTHLICKISKRNVYNFVIYVHLMISNKPNNIYNCESIRFFSIYI